MKKWEGSRWGELTEKEKEELLRNANTVDAVTGKENLYEMPECIVDLTEYLSVPGKVVDGEIIIDDDAVIYVSDADYSEDE